MPVPEVSATDGPIWVEPSKNETLPVMVPAVLEVTLAVNMTLAPAVDGLSDDVTVVVVAAFVAAFTVWVSVGEVLVA